MQRYIDSIIRGTPCCYAYVDDLFIASSDEESHKKYLDLVFSKLSEHLIVTSRRHVRSFIPVLTSHHWSGPEFVSGDLLKASHVVLRIHRIRKSLEPTYAGPYKVMSRTSKEFTMDVNGTPVTVSIDRLKAVYIFPDEVASRNSSPIPTCSAQNSDVANRYGIRSRQVVQF
ncbi:hypothetical protein AVEN_39233-1 [Araneus ventricosus]|uniref:Reverse transcriptase domain-containing protein n=1 Tax=Araneus ventricosus TaxID=182803 RepID=A0A4Y2EU43_ARAVE|nr:hypothetical protein AVEN_39233-1 [Araneus ventricosus]